MHYTYWYHYQFRWYHLIFPVLFFGVGVFIFLNAIGFISSTPDWALERFCSDLQQGGNMQDAYDLFSSDYQSSHTAADFLQIWSKRDFSTCVHTLSASSDGRTSGTLTTPDAVYQVTLIQNNIIDWKISNMSP